MEIRGIKAWFVEKNFSQSERMIVSEAFMGGEVKAERETEKAVLAVFPSDYGTIKRWVPKSCLLSAADIEAADKKLTAGLDYNQRLIELAKASGLRARKGMRTATVMLMLEAAGIAIPARA